MNISEQHIFIFEQHNNYLDTEYFPLLYQVQLLKSALKKSRSMDLTVYSPPPLVTEKLDKVALSFEGRP